jgi:hypothetical protein
MWHIWAEGNIGFWLAGLKERDHLEDIGVEAAKRASV